MGARRPWDAPGAQIPATAVSGRAMHPGKPLSVPASDENPKHGPSARAEYGFECHISRIVDVLVRREF
jgi:hypothetical protein